jgi:signal transduction histidine kinase
VHTALPLSTLNIAVPFVQEAARWVPESAFGIGAAGTGSVAERSEIDRPKKDRILVVDDNADMREYLGHLLRDWTVESAADGRAALERVRSDPPSLIVTDVMMPGLDGFALLHEMRADARTRSIPVLMLSARAGEEARVTGFGAGADEYLVKPFSARELVARVSSLLNLSRARREAELQKEVAEAASRTKDQFLAMLGHELRNPLAPISTALQLMSLKANDTFLTERTIIDRQVRHLVRLVDDLLDVSRIARGKIELRRQPLDLGIVVAAAVEAVSPLLEERRHQLTVSVPRGLVVSGDMTRLTQVVMNLVNNAAKYTQPGGAIVIDAALQDETIVLRVRDTGIGISSEMLPHVFEIFAQERQAPDRAAGGLGLGLSIVKSLVELHRGTVSAASQGLGHGCEITVRLPKARSGAVADADSTDRGYQTRAAQPGRRILIVDDNVDAARTMADALALAGYDTRVSFDGPAALAAAAAFRPEAVLLDLGLPLMDGYEVAKEIRSGSSDKPPILVAVTGYGQKADQERTRTAGFSGHVIKPIDLAQVIAVLEGFLACP